MLLVDVKHLFGEAPALFQTKDAQPPDRVRQHADWGDAEVVPVKAAQRISNCGDQIRAAPDWFGNEDIRPALLGQLIGGLDQRIEAAAETAPRDFLGGEALGP